VRVKDTRARARSKRKHESTLFLFLSSSSTSVVAHRVSRVVSSSLVIKSLLRTHIIERFMLMLYFSIFFASLSLSRETREEEEEERSTCGCLEKKKQTPPKKISSLLMHTEPPSPPCEKEDKGKLEISLATFCISFFIVHHKTQVQSINNKINNVSFFFVITTILLRFHEQQRRDPSICWCE